MKIHTSLFEHSFIADSLVDIGLKRTSNQDEVIMCPEEGFFAVSDGMGGLPNGGKTSQMIQKILPSMIKNALNDLLKNASPEYAAELLSGQIRMLSDTIYDTGNKDDIFNFGATLSGVWLVNHQAIFVNLGDSRGYLLPKYKKRIKQVTIDHNVAAILVKQGEISKEEARNHPASSNLTRFVGMDAPATPEVFIQEVHPGDRILLCSDGLHGMINDSVLPSIMRSTANPARVCERLIKTANTNGGRDNISVIYIKVLK